MLQRELSRSRNAVDNLITLHVTDAYTYGDGNSVTQTPVPCLCFT